MSVYQEKNVEVRRSGNIVQEQRLVSSGPSTSTIFVSRLSRLIWFIISVISISIAFRFILLSIGANETSPFVNMIYSVTGVLVAPFQFIASNIEYTGGVIEVASIFAFVVYPIVGWGIIQLLWIVFSGARRTRQETTVQYDA